MAYLIISPKVLECACPKGGLVECAITYDMQEYGIHTRLASCAFSLSRPVGLEGTPCIRVKDATLSTPLYDAFWRGFCWYVDKRLCIDFFSEGPLGSGARKFYFSDVHFDPMKREFTTAGVKVSRH